MVTRGMRLAAGVGIGFLASLFVDLTSRDSSAASEPRLTRRTPQPAPALTDTQLDEKMGELQEWAQKEAERRFAQLQEDAHEELDRIELVIAGQQPTFRMLNTTPEDYLDQEVVLHGYAELQPGYTFRGAYSQYRQSHFGLELRDLNRRRVWCCFPKDEHQALFDMLGNAEGRVPLRITAIMRREFLRPDSASYNAVGLAWEPLDESYQWDQLPDDVIGSDGWFAKAALDATMGNRSNAEHKLQRALAVLRAGREKR